MSLSVQVLYPTAGNTTFDHDYYMNTHMKIVGDNMGAQIASTLIAKGAHGGPDTPAPFHVVATMTFADEAALNAAMANIGPVAGDIPNFYNGAPQMLFGEVIG